MMQKTVNAKTKAGLRSNIMVWNTDFYYLRSYCLSQNIVAKMQTQGLTTKKSKPKESRPKKAKLVNDKSFALLYSNEAFKFNC